MTDKELEKKAEEWAAQRTINKNMLCIAYMRAYIAGAKENGVKWHDLRKDPNDLPHLDEVVLLYKSADKLPMQGYRHIPFGRNDWVWRIRWGNGYDLDPREYDFILWCEIPKFEED